MTRSPPSSPFELKGFHVSVAISRRNDREQPGVFRPASAATLGACLGWVAGASASWAAAEGGGGTLSVQLKGGGKVSHHRQSWCSVHNSVYKCTQVLHLDDIRPPVTARHTINRAPVWSAAKRKTKDGRQRVAVTAALLPGLEYAVARQLPAKKGRRKARAAGGYVSAAGYHHHAFARECAFHRHALC